MLPHGKFFIGILIIWKYQINRKAFIQKHKSYGEFLLAAKNLLRRQKFAKDND